MLPIINMEYSLPVVEEPQPDYRDEKEKIQHPLPQTPVDADLAPLLRDSMKIQKWTFYLLVFIAAVAASQFLR